MLPWPRVLLQNMREPPLPTTLLQVKGRWNHYFNILLLRKQEGLGLHSGVFL